ncbi:thioredoxin [Salinarimonas ramus]|uniref:Thioredoxin n=1 Tax=Salinarimonas ramus TaxID=690164 RepID=A0A917Q7M3_9HYPH|nr:thioredoxin [Salinarimonas ramus]GGK34014.1 thioredoxin [Salinarimonas ramus]
MLADGSNLGGGLPDGAPADLIKDTTTATFREDVIAASMRTPVLVDFWAPWCGPCKQLTPVIEKVVRAAKGKVKLVKMNIDEHPSIAGQLGIQSIPAVIAFVQGQPVDGFMGAQPESQIKAFIDKLSGAAGPSPVEQALEEAATRAGKGDAQGAAELYAAVLQREPDNMVALGGMAKLHVDLGDVDGAEQMLAMAPPEKAQDPALVPARKAIELARQAAALGDVAELEARVSANPDDHQARFDLALALNARNERVRAAEALVEIVRRDRSWNEDGARKQLVEFFEAWGPKDEATMVGRRKLSSVLFR